MPCIAYRYTHPWCKSRGTGRRVRKILSGRTLARIVPQIKNTPFRMHQNRPFQAKKVVSDIAVFVPKRDVKLNQPSSEKFIFFWGRRPSQKNPARFTSLQTWYRFSLQGSGNVGTARSAGWYRDPPHRCWRRRRRRSDTNQSRRPRYQPQTTHVDNCPPTGLTSCSERATANDRPAAKQMPMSTSIR